MVTGSKRGWRIEVRERSRCVQKRRRGGEIREGRRERLGTGNVSIRVFPRDVVLPCHDPYPPSMFYMMCPVLL